MSITPDSEHVDSRPRRLIVMRHAKSSWADPGQSDHARPLNERGRRDAPKVAARLVQLAWCPDFVLCSDAHRTRETWELMNETFASHGTSPGCLLTHSLYLASYGELLAAVAVVDDAARTLLVLGHNPGWEGIVHTLTGESITLKTANAALLAQGEPARGALADGGGSWQDALRHRGDWRKQNQIVSRDL